MPTYAGMPAWTGAQPLSYADELSRRQAWQASQGRGGQLGIDAMEDWARLSGDRGNREFFGTGTRGGQTTGRGGQGYFGTDPSLLTPDPSVARYNDFIGGIQSGATPVSIGGTPMQPAGTGGAGLTNPYGAFTNQNLPPGTPGPITAPYAGAPGAGQMGQPGMSLGQIANGQGGGGEIYDQIGGGGDVQFQHWGSGDGWGQPGAGRTPTGGMPANSGYENFDFTKWRDPGYDFRLAEGQKLLQGSAAARGGLLSGATLKDLTNYGQGAASQEYANAFDRFQRERDFARGRFVGDRTFDYLADVGDRDFAYRAAVGDRDYQTDADRYLTSLGYGATGGTVNSNERMALLQSALEQARGNVGAAGTMGGSNAVTNALQAAIKQMIENRYYPPPG